MLRQWIACAFLGALLVPLLAAEALADDVFGRAYYNDGGSLDYEMGADAPLPNQPVQLWVLTNPPQFVDSTTTEMDGSFLFMNQPSGFEFEVRLDVSQSPTPAGALASIAFTDPTMFNPNTDVTMFAITDMPVAGPVMTTGPGVPAKVGFPLVRRRPEGAANKAEGRAYFNDGGTLDYEMGADVPLPGQPVRLWQLNPEMMLEESVTDGDGRFSFQTQLMAPMTYEVRLDVSGSPMDAGSIASIVFTDPNVFNPNTDVTMFPLTDNPVAGPVMTDAPARPRKVGFPLVRRRPEGEPNAIVGRAYFNDGGSLDYEEGADAGLAGQPVQLWQVMPPVLLAAAVTGGNGEFAFPPQAPNMEFEVRLDVRASVQPAGAIASIVFTDPNMFNPNTDVTMFAITAEPVAGPVMTDAPARPRKVGFPLVRRRPEGGGMGPGNGGMNPDGDKCRFFCKLRKWFWRGHSRHKNRCGRGHTKHGRGHGRGHDKSDKSGKSGRSDKCGKSDKSGKSGRSDKCGKSDKSDKSTKKYGKKKYGKKKYGKKKRGKKKRGRRRR